MDPSAYRSLVVSETRCLLKILSKRGLAISLPDDWETSLDILEIEATLERLKALARTPD